MQHRIKKQFLILLVDPGLDVFALQQAVSSFYWAEIVPILERLFDELSPPGTAIRLDKLEIDLGLLTEGSFREGGIRDELYILLREQLKKMLDQEEGEKTHLVLRESTPANSLRQWWYYMEHGHLHWSQVALTDNWYREVLEIFSVDYAAISQLRELIQKDARMLQRVAAQHTDDFLEKLTGILVAEKLGGLDASIGAVLGLVRWLAAEYRARPERQADHLSGRSLIRWQARHQDHLTLPVHRQKESIWRLLLREAAVRPELLRKEGGARLLVDWLLAGDPILAGYVEKKVIPLPAPIAAVVAESSRGDGQDQQAEETNDETSRKTIPETPAEASPPIDGREVDEEGIYVPHAGIILLHPFLSTCFSRPSWWVDGRFVDADAQQKAVFLLHYLATGEEEAMEYQLVFPKLLCGLPAETPLPMKTGLSPEEYAEAEELLQMVLIRWEKLRATSVGGLREGFLQRNGKLVRRNDQLTLLVERQAIDVLLDYLPWNLSLVKLPWLNNILFVEWR